MDRDADSSERTADPVDPASDVTPAELADRVGELEDAVREIRRRTVRPPRGPFGLPRPPTPSEVLAFTDRHAIPATVAFLEANVRALEALQAALRLVRGADETRDQTRTARARTATLGSKTLDALDAALDDLQTTYREGGLPDDPAARSVLVDARRLTDEIREELSVEAHEADEDAHQAADDSSDTRGTTTGDPRVDPAEVETELDVLRDEFGTDDTGGAGVGGDEDGGGVGGAGLGGDEDGGGVDGDEGRGDDDSRDTDSNGGAGRRD